MTYILVGFTQQERSMKRVIVDRTYKLLNGYANKYVVVTINGEKCLWAPHAEISSHQALVTCLEHALGQKVQCEGGGRLLIHDATRSIYIWDVSATYGPEDDREETRGMLGDAFLTYMIADDPPPSR